MTATWNDEDISRFLEVMESRGYEVRKKDASSAGRVNLEEKHFRRLEKFVGDTGTWQGWLFNLFVCVAHVSGECVTSMERVVQGASVTVDPKNVGQLVDPVIMKNFAHELFTVLCMVTGGEANVVVRSCVQKGYGYCGFAALCLLCQRFNPKTPTRILQLLTNVLQPPGVKNVRLLAHAIE